MTVQLKSSKTNVYRRGQSLTIARTSSTLFAVSAMREYFLLAQPQEGPLFYFQSGSFLTLGAVSDLLRDSSRAAGLRYQCLKGHSVRISGASVAADSGLPDWLIKVMGCWSSDCYQVYIRTPQTTLESVAPRMASMAWEDALPCMHQWRLSQRSDFPQACFFIAFEYRTCICEYPRVTYE